MQMRGGPEGPYRPLRMSAVQERMLPLGPHRPLHGLKGGIVQYTPQMGTGEALKEVSRSPIPQNQIINRFFLQNEIVLHERRVITLYFCYLDQIEPFHESLENAEGITAK